MKREKLILVVVVMVCSFAVGTAFAQYELQKPTWCVVDCGLNGTIGTRDYANGLDTGDSVGYRLDCSIGGIGPDDTDNIYDNDAVLESPTGETILEPGFYHINYDGTIENPTFVFDDKDITTTTIKFKLDTGSNPDWTQYAIAFSSAVKPSDLFTGTTYYIDENGDTSLSFNESNDWNPASFYEEKVELIQLNPNTIYGFKIRSRVSLAVGEDPKEGVFTEWSVDADTYTWTHIETPGINVKVYITSATVRAVGPFTNLGEGLSGINYRIKDQGWEGWTTETSHTFTSLADNTSYIFEVKARNGRQYETDVDSTSEYTLCGPPESPYITSVSSCSLTLGWSHSILGAPEYYQIKQEEEFIDDNGDDIPDKYYPPQLSLDRDNLEYVNFLYTYQIYAVNQDDEYDEISSVSISTYTFCSIPPAPEIEGVSADTIKIVLYEGSDPGDNPFYTEYSIKVFGGGSVSFVQDDHRIGGSEVFNTTTDWGDLTISNLLSNVEYDISVQAMNKYGYVTGYGASVSSCTYATVPGLEVKEIALDSVDITILEGNNSPQTEYAIYQEINMGGGWQMQGYLQLGGGTHLSNPVWQTKDDWESGGFIVSDLNLTAYGFRWKAQARRTITGYSKEETGWSLYAYAGKVLETPVATIGLEQLDVGETVYYKEDSTVTFTSSGADEIHYSYTDNGLNPEDPTRLFHPGGLPPVPFALTASLGESLTYKIKARAWKGTGPDALVSDIGGVWVVVIDRDPPTIDSFSISGGTQTSSQIITLLISATGADEMEISGDVIGEGKWIKYSSSKNVLLTEGEGDKTVSIIVKDKAENKSDPESKDIKYDPYPPSITGFKIEEGDYTNTRDIHLIDIKATYASDMLIYGDVEDGDWIDYSDSAQVTLTSGDGEKIVRVKVANALGTQAGPEIEKITLDTIEPQDPKLTLSDTDSPNPDYTNDTIVDVSVTTSDTDLAEFILSDDQAYSVKPNEDDPEWKDVLLIPSTFDLLPGDGPKTVFLWVKDHAEHINVGVSSATIILDTQAPENPYLSIDGGSSFTNSPDITLQISATGAYEMWIDSDVVNTGSTMEWIIYASSALVTLTPGDVEKTVTIKFRDKAGNVTPPASDPPVSATVTLETTLPEIQGNIGARFVKHDNEELEEGIETGCQTPTFVWKATDTASGVDGYSYSFSTDIGAEPDDTLDPTIDSSILLKLTSSDSDDIYYFKVKAKDKAGNFSEVKSFAYNYKADWGFPEVESIDIEGKKRIEDEVKGVERKNTLPEIGFTEEVWGVEEYVEVEVIRDNEGEEKNTKVNCTITYEGGLWKIDPGKDWQGNYTYRVKAKDGIEDNAGNKLKEEKELTFTTMLDRTKRNVVMWESDPKTKVILEANALKEDGYISINLEPLPLEKTGGAIEAKQVNPEAIIEADEKMKRSGDRYCYNLRESMRETSGYTTEGGEMVIKKFLNTVYIELPYADEDEDGRVDSTQETSAPVSVKTLSVYWLDEEHRLWVKVAGTEVDKDEKVARAKVMGFGVYTLMGGGFYDLSDAYAYPVPYKPNDGLSITGDETSGITFTNLSTEAEIKIYTITGELVKKLIHKNGWYEEWYPIENEKGEKVVSGVYIYYIENIKQHKSGKLVIIR